MARLPSAIMTLHGTGLPGEEEFGPGSQVGPLAFSGDMIELGSQLGSGATAVVYECRRLRTGESLAVKAIDIGRLSRLEDNALALRRLETEVQALREAQHVRCLGLRDIYRSTRWVFLVMEKLTGGELFDQITSKKRFSEPEARYVFQQVCEGLQFLHSRHILHRDVKPENILIASSQEVPAPDGRGTITLYDVKLADYGLSKHVTSGVAASMVGTPQYWAPEVLAAGGHSGDSAHYDHRADLWSLGVTLYVMLRGQYPFKGANPNEMIRTGQYDLDSGSWMRVSDNAKDLVRKLLRVRAEERLSIEECLQHPWVSGVHRAASSTAPVSAPRDAWTAEAPTALVQWEHGEGLRVGGDGAGEAFSLRELVQLQVSVIASLEMACLACRDRHPHLAADIQLALHQASQLWQKALVVIRQYARVSNEVRQRVLPDLQLAVQEAEPSLAIELLDMVHGWTSQMRQDGDAAQRLCSDLGRHLRELILKTQQEKNKSEDATPLKVHGLNQIIEKSSVLEPVPPKRAETASSDASGVSCEAGAGMETFGPPTALKPPPPAQPPPAQEPLKTVNRATQALFEGLACFAQSIAASDPVSADAECAKRDIIDLLFLAPGAGHIEKASAGGAAALVDGRSTSGGRFSSDGGECVEPPAPHRLRPAAAGKDEREGSGLAVAGQLAVRELHGHWDLAHPLLKALQELRRVSQILSECMDFWTNMDCTVQELTRLKDHVGSFVKHAAKSARLRARFDERLTEYSNFWASLMTLCEQYCAAVEPALFKMRALITKVETIADTMDTAGLVEMDVPGQAPVPMHD